MITRWISHMLPRTVAGRTVTMGVGQAIEADARHRTSLTLFGMTAATDAAPARAVVSTFDGLLERELDVVAGEPFDAGRTRWVLEHVSSAGPTANEPPGAIAPPRLGDPGPRRATFRRIG